MDVLQSRSNDELHALVARDESAQMDLRLEFRFVWVLDFLLYRRYISLRLVFGDLLEHLKLGFGHFV